MRSNYVCRMKCRTETHIDNLKKNYNVQFCEDRWDFDDSFLLTNQRVSYLITHPNHFSDIGLVDKTTTHSF